MRPSWQHCLIQGKVCLHLYFSFRSLYALAWPWGLFSGRIEPFLWPPVDGKTFRRLYGRRVLRHNEGADGKCQVTSKQDMISWEKENSDYVKEVRGYLVDGAEVLCSKYQVSNVKSLHYDTMRLCPLNLDLRMSTASTNFLFRNHYCPFWQD